MLAVPSSLYSIPLVPRMGRQHFAAERPQEIQILIAKPSPQKRWKDKVITVVTKSPGLAA